MLNRRRWRDLRSEIRGRVCLEPSMNLHAQHTQVHSHTYDMTDRPAYAHMYTYMLECTHVIDSHMHTSVCTSSHKHIAFWVSLGLSIW